MLELAPGALIKFPQGERGRLFCLYILGLKMTPYLFLGAQTVTNKHLENVIENDFFVKL